MRRILNATTGAGGGQGRGLDGAGPDAPVLSAVAAYDLVAPGYRKLSEKRRAYLDAVDAEIVRRVPGGSAALMDVGAGDGRRALQIAERAGIRRVVLVEPSAGMRELIPAGPEVWNERIEALPDVGRVFDVVLCLWNVLGHVPGWESRLGALRNLRRVCSAGGLIFVDVLNRYNMAECGIGVVLRRFLSPRNGDVPVKWRIDGAEINTQGYIFSAHEMRTLFRDAGLRVVEREALNYRTGRREPWSLAGNLLYVLRAD
jgi:2-polyprenyl-3-methyl-5-hydroxy-6-metoxy-1,4-benzoquinol methylase